jgi:hypothetical protein
VLLHESRQPAAWLTCNVRQKMKSLTALLGLLLAGCTTATKIPSDYITGLREPVALKAYLLILDGGSGALQLTDASGREVSIYQDSSGANHEGRKKSRHGREIGAVVLADLSSGRTIDYAGPEGTRLLTILDGLKLADADEVRGVRLFADFIRSKRKAPNQPSEPTPPSVTDRAAARSAPDGGVAHL